MPAERVLTILWILVLAHIALTWLLAIRRGRRARRSEVRNRHPLMKNPLPVSIIVPAWNEKGTLDKCLSALQEENIESWEALMENLKAIYSPAPKKVNKTKKAA